MTEPSADDIKAIFGGLLLRAGELAKKVLTAYSITGSRTANIKAISKFTIDFLEACAEFLEIELADSDSNKVFTKDTLVARILFAIEALLPAPCKECSLWYNVDIEPQDPPAFQCYTCFRKSHGCDAMKKVQETLSNISLSSGHIWLCSNCHGRHNPINPRKTKVKHSSEVPSQVASQAPSEQPSRHDAEDETPVLDKEDLTRKLEKAAKQRVCARYAKGKCPHGLRGAKVVNGATCPDNHPRKCKKYCGYGDKGPKGCKQGSDCRYYHPILCRGSVTKQLCTNKDCTFVHMSGTARRGNPKHSSNREGPANRDGMTTPSRRNRERSRSSNSVTFETPAGASTPKSPKKPDAFLELKGMIQQMHGQFQKEIASLRANMLHHAGHKAVNPYQHMMFNNMMPLGQPTLQSSF